MFSFVPASCETDREAVRLLAIQFGVREAARRSGLSEDRVRQWSSRFNWLQRSTPEQQKAIVTTVTSPGDIMLQELERNGHATKLSLSRFARNAAGKHERGPITKAPLLHKVAQTAAIVHGWQDKQGPQTNVMVNVALLGVEPGSVQVEAETLDVTPES